MPPLPVDILKRCGLATDHVNPLAYRSTVISCHSYSFLPEAIANQTSYCKLLRGDWTASRDVEKDCFRVLYLIQN